MNGNWNDEIVEKNSWIQGPGQEFVLTFFFSDDEIVVYTNDVGRGFQYKYSNKFNIDDIRSVEVWGDVEYVNEIIFRYKK